MKIFEVTRRGFLKGLAGAAATAATPGGVANLVKTAAAEPAAATGASNVLALLFKAASNAAFDLGIEGPEYDYDTDEEGKLGWDESNTAEQGEYGEMPWGQYYEAGTTPNGVPYLHTADSDDGNQVIFSFMDNGKPQYIVIQHDRGGYSEVIDTSDTKYMTRLDNCQDDHEGEPSAIVDAALNPEYDSVPRVQTAVNDDDGQSISDITRLAGIAKKGYDAVSQSQPEPTTKHMGDIEQDVPALPAPDNSNTLEPNIKQHDKVPTKKHQNK
jgi:hypothetical protein